MHKPDRADWNECFKTLFCACEIVKYYVENISIEQRIDKNYLGDIQILSSILYSSDISYEEAMEIERFRKLQDKEMRKHMEKPRDSMECARDVGDGQSVTVASEEQYKAFGSQGFVRKQAP